MKKLPFFILFCDFQNFTKINFLKTKLGSDRVSRFDVYRLQTPKQTNKVYTIYIEDLGKSGVKTLFLFKLFKNKLKLVYCYLNSFLIIS